MAVEGTLTMENATIVFRNFAGREGKFNREGDRNFCVLLDEKTAEAMDRDGWSVKSLRAREEGDPDQPYIQVSVGYKYRPPRIFLNTSKSRTPIPEEMLEVLDWVDIAKVDLTIRPYHWGFGGKSGIKAYLQTLYITIHEDPLDQKYEHLEELPARGGRTAELEAAPEHVVIDGEVV